MLSKYIVPGNRIEIQSVERVKLADDKERKKVYASQVREIISEDQLEIMMPMEYLGAVPEDTQLSRAVMQQNPVSLANPNAKSSLAYEEIAAKLMNKEIEGKIFKRGMAAFFSHIIAGKKNN